MGIVLCFMKIGQKDYEFKVLQKHYDKSLWCIQQIMLANKFIHQIRFNPMGSAMLHADEARRTMIQVLHKHLLKCLPVL